jgi:hypothetical protein
LKKFIIILFFFSSVQILAADVMSMIENYLRGNLTAIADEEGKPIKCGTFYNLLVHQHWNRLNSELQALYLEKITQVREKEKSLIIPSGHFMLHWDESGSDSVSIEDLTGNGIPDYIDSAAVILEYVWQVEINRLGYDIPPGSDGQPVSIYHIYFSDLSDIYGQTWFENFININKSRTIFSSFIELENDYAEEEGFYSSGLAGLKVTAAHEFHHAIQFGYNFQEQQFYFYEMTAVWMEDVVYPEINDYYQYLPYFFQEVKNASFNLFNGSYPYANCLYLHMISQKYGNEMIKIFWEDFTSKTDFIEIIDDRLRQDGSNWLETLNEYALWLYHTDDRADTLNYFPEGDLYPQIQLNDADIITLNDQVLVRPLANCYVQLYGIKNLHLQFIAQEHSGIAGFCYLFPEGREGFYPIQSFIECDYDTLILVITNGGRTINSFKLDFAGDKPNDIFPYPNPVIASQDGCLRFINVPHDATIYIYSVSGKKVITMNRDYHSVIRVWDLKNHQGKTVPAGIYLFLIESKAIHQLGKFAVIR